MSKLTTRTESEDETRLRIESVGSKKRYKKQAAVYPSSGKNSYYDSFRLKKGTPTKVEVKAEEPAKTAVEPPESSPVVLRAKLEVEAEPEPPKLELTKSATCSAVPDSGAKKEIHKSGCTYHKTNKCYVRSENGKYYKLPSDTYHKLSDACYIKLSNGSFKHLIIKNTNTNKDEDKLIDDDDDESRSSVSNCNLQPTITTTKIKSNRISQPVASTVTANRDRDRDKIKSVIVGDNSNGKTMTNANQMQPANRKVMVTMIDGGLPVVAKAIDKKTHGVGKKEKVKVIFILG